MYVGYVNIQPEAATMMEYKISGRFVLDDSIELDDEIILTVHSKVTDHHFKSHPVHGQIEHMKVNVLDVMVLAGKEATEMQLRIHGKSQSRDEAVVHRALDSETAADDESFEP